MTPDEFRVIALSMPEAVEASHMDHPDFRVKNKIFATLWPDDDWGMVKLTPEQQAAAVKAKPKVFVPVNGSWGLRGATRVLLAAADKASVRSAMISAWRNTAPKSMVEQLDGPRKK